MTQPALQIPDLVPEWFRPWFRGLPGVARWPLGLAIIAGCCWATWVEVARPTDGTQKAFIWLLLAAVATTLLMELTRPKPKVEDAKPIGLGDFNFPTATEGRPVQLLVGRVLIKGVNDIWHGDLSQGAITEKVKTGFFSSQKITKGFRYNLAIQFALCRGPGVVLVRVLIGEEEAFSGTVTSGDFFDINKPNILGGDEFGAGGVLATVDFYGGEKTQDVSAYLNTDERQRIATAITPTAPRYTGTSYVLIRQPTGVAPTPNDIGAYIGNSTSIKPWAVEVERFPDLFAGQTAGQNKIGSFDANPINWAYEIITNVEWGLGKDPSKVDVGAGSTFVKASDNMITEGNGYARLLDRTVPAQDMLDEVAEQIDGAIFFDHRVEKWIVQLVRDPSDPNFGYDIDTVPQFTDEEVRKVPDLTRGSWEDTVNQISVKYSKRDDEYKESYALAQDMANAISIAFGSVLDPISNPGIVSYPGVKNSALASNLAWRELRGQSFPFLRGTFVVNRKFFDLILLGVFAYINERMFPGKKVAMRVTRIDYGTLKNNEMKVAAIQDVLGFAAASMGTPGATKWTPPVVTPVAFPAAQQVAFEAPRALVVRNPAFSGNDQVAKVWCGARRQGGEVAFEIRQRNAAGAPAGSFFFAGDVVAFLRIGQLDTDLSAGTAIPTASILVNPTPDAQVILEGLFDDEATLVDLGVDLVQCVRVNDEFMLVADAADSGPDVDLQNVYRGVMGTAQANHAAGDDVFLVFVAGGLTDTTFPNTNNVDVELRMRSAIATFEGAVTTISLTMSRRAMRPYPPPAAFYNGSASRFGTPALEGDGAGLNGVGFDVDWHRSAFDTTDELQELLGDNPNLDPSTEFRVSVFVDPSGSNDLAFQSAWTTGTGPLTPTQAEVVTFGAAGTEVRVQVEVRHDIAALTNLEGHVPLIHDVTPTSARTSQFYLGGNLRALDVSSAYVVANAGVHTVNIGAAYATSDVEHRINGGSWLVIIAAGLTTGATAALSVTDTVELRHTVNEAPDPQFVEVNDGSDVAYGAFSA